MVRKRCPAWALATLLLMVCAVASAAEKAQPSPADRDRSVKKEVSKSAPVEPAGQEPNTAPQQSPGPKPSILGEPMVSADGTRIYYPYVPYRPYYHPYSYSYGYPAYPYAANDSPNLLLFNQELDMALIWDRFRQQFRWEPIVPPRPYSVPTGPQMRRAEVRAAQPEREAEDNTIRSRVVEPVPERIPEAVVPSGASAVVGEVVRTVLSGRVPEIVVRAGDEETTYLVAQDALLVRGAVGERAVEARLDEMHAGDRVKLRFAEEGLVDSIRAEYKVVSGKVHAIAKGTVLLETGETFKLAPNARVLLSEDAKGKPEDIKAGSIVRAEVSPISENAYLVRVTSVADQEPPATKDEGAPDSQKTRQQGE